MFFNIPEVKVQNVMQTCTESKCQSKMYFHLCINGRGGHLGAFHIFCVRKFVIFNVDAMLFSKYNICCFVFYICPITKACFMLYDFVNLHK